MEFLASVREPTADCQLLGIIDTYDASAMVECSRVESRLPART